MNIKMSREISRHLYFWTCVPCPLFHFPHRRRRRFRCSFPDGVSLRHSPLGSPPLATTHCLGAHELAHAHLSGRARGRGGPWNVGVDGVCSGRPRGQDLNPSHSRQRFPPSCKQSRYVPFLCAFHYIRCLVPYHSSGSQSRNPLAKGLLAIFSWVIYKKPQKGVTISKFIQKHSSVRKKNLRYFSGMSIDN